MTKTTRTRSDNLYTIDEDGVPVAQAEAVSRAEAVALWEESKRRPAVSARLATARESRDLAHLPLLTRGAAPERDPRVGDLFDGVHDAPVSPVVGALIDAPVLTRHELITEIVQAEMMAAYSPPVDLPVKTYPPEALAQIVADREPAPVGLDAEAVAIMERLSDVLPMVPPQHAPIAAVTEVLSSGAQERRRLFPDPPKGAGKVEAKYRNPETGESWSGRGLKPRWLVMAIDAGKTLEDFLI